MRITSHRSGRSGFTLIELVVTVGIFVFMTALVIARYSSFNQGTLMTNLAYDVALAAHTAQTYGVSVKNSDQNGGNNYDTPYGVDFVQSGTCGDSSPTQFVLFADVDKDGHYDCGSGVDRVVSRYAIKQGAKISNLTACHAYPCSDPTDFNLTHVDATFRRPDPSAVICRFKNSAWDCTSVFFAITVTSGNGESSRLIVILPSGQITVINT